MKLTAKGLIKRELEDGTYPDYMFTMVPRDADFIRPRLVGCEEVFMIDEITFMGNFGLMDKETEEMIRGMG